MLQKILTFFKKALFLAPDETGALLPSFVTAGILSFLWGFLLIGIPGALLMLAFKLMFSKLGMETPPDSEATWGLVILVSLAMPMTIPAAHFFARFGFPRQFWALCALTAGWWVILGAWSAWANPK